MLYWVAEWGSRVSGREWFELSSRTSSHLHTHNQVISIPFANDMVNWEEHNIAATIGGQREKKKGNL